MWLAKLLWLQQMSHCQLLIIKRASATWWSPTSRWSPTWSSHLAHHSGICLTRLGRLTDRSAIISLSIAGSLGWPCSVCCLLLCLLPWLLVQVPTWIHHRHQQYNTHRYCCSCLRNAGRWLHTEQRHRQDSQVVPCWHLQP
jgi:hypothetical protein